MYCILRSTSLPNISGRNLKFTLIFAVAAERKISGCICSRVEEVGCADCLHLLFNHSHLMPTIKLLPHYLFDCQDGAHNQYAIHPFHIYWSGRLACVCVSAQSAQTNRLVESSGVGWATAHGFVLFFWYCLFAEGNAESIKMHLTQNKINTRGEKPLDGSGLSVGTWDSQARDLWGSQLSYLLSQPSV